MIDKPTPIKSHIKFRKADVVTVKVMPFCAIFKEYHTPPHNLPELPPTDGYHLRKPLQLFATLQITADLAT